MRYELKRHEGERSRYRATFERYGSESSYRGLPQKTVLLKGVTEMGSGTVVADHLWFTCTKGFQALGELQPGAVIEFDARVKAYRAGYRGHDLEAMDENPPRIDYKLAWPTKIRCAAD